MIRLISIIAIIQLCGVNFGLAQAQLPSTTEPTNNVEVEVETIRSPVVLESWNSKDRSGNDVSLTQLNGNPFIAIIFRGHGCYRCVEQLGKFAEVEQMFRQRGVRLVAVSNESVAEMGKALNATPLPFPVLSDEGSKLSTSLNKKEIENWHGLLIIDASGKTRWIASGSKPLMDFRQVIAAIDELRLARDALKSHEIPDRQTK